MCHEKYYTMVVTMSEGYMQWIVRLDFAVKTMVIVMSKKLYAVDCEISIWSDDTGNEGHFVTILVWHQRRFYTIEICSADSPVWQECTCAR
jgi:hypothetical protein